MNQLLLEPRKHFHLELFTLKDTLAGHLQHAVVLYQSWFVAWVEINKTDNFEKEKLQFTSFFPPNSLMSPFETIFHLLHFNLKHRSIYFKWNKVNKMGLFCSNDLPVKN